MAMMKTKRKTKKVQKTSLSKARSILEKLIKEEAEKANHHLICSIEVLLNMANQKEKKKIYSRYKIPISCTEALVAKVLARRTIQDMFDHLADILEGK
jgi:hypothetical protein